MPQQENATQDIRPAHPRYVLVGPETPLIWRLALASVILITLLTAIYVARTVVLPIVLALLFSFLLSPIVRFLEGFHIPTPLGAALVMATLVGLAGTALVVLAEPASQWVSRAPEVASELRLRLHGVMEVFRRLSESTRLVERIASGPSAAGPTVDIQGGGLRGFLLGRTWEFVAGLLMMLFLLYFLLATGHMFLRRLVTVIPRFGDKRRAVVMVRHMEREVSHYLFTVGVINTVLGVVVGLVMHVLEMPNPLLWGAMAGLLNFVPYLGPMVTLVVLTAVSVLSFDTLTAALMRPAAFLVLTTLEGQLLTPLILGARLMLNPVVIFVSLIFWGWLWGIVGALIAVPLTMIIKILLDAIPSLRAAGALLSR
ncbi:AI-2E family transporter [Thiohalomonas denitrificans]|uniref:Predicted PurR-regulated permease PerM n=1 Tax=Thiohalomonas denitrificans TaxID=415747 RepID=A0A1G5PQL8_9GAMM|nr:AI-2E family transporter [Thiohalomonas denitrificans]SCZ51874.1 Predicted PurR-regulated permease PerM [Thiohalomonas denitrificans]